MQGEHGMENEVNNAWWRCTEGRRVKCGGKGRRGCGGERGRDTEGEKEEFQEGNEMKG